MIISMGFVAPAFCARFKERTMRDWTPRQIKMVTDCYDRDINLSVWSSCPRVKGAERIGFASLKEPPYKQNIKDIFKHGLFNSTYLAEGFGYMDDKNNSLWNGFHNLAGTLDKEFTILNFNPNPTPEANAKYTTPEMISKYRIKLQKWMNDQVRTVA